MTRRQVARIRVWCALGYGGLKGGRPAFDGRLCLLVTLCDILCVVFLTPCVLSAAFALCELDAGGSGNAPAVW